MALSPALDLTNLVDRPITTNYGEPSAFTGEPHTGIDVGIPVGTPVSDPVAGVVERVWTDATGGLQIAIRDAAGFLQVFAHLSHASVVPGQGVDVGTPIGLSGESGHVTGPHLHYEVRNPAGSPVDPHSFLSEFSPTATRSATAAPVTQPAGWQCAILLTTGANPALASKLTGIPETELQAAAYACANGVKNTPLPFVGTRDTLFAKDSWNPQRIAFTAVGVGLILFGVFGYMGALRGPSIVVQPSEAH